jgi:predicted ABC-class ATPase
MLRQKIIAIDGHDYAAYQSLINTYDFNLFSLRIQQIPKDPYAPPHTGIYRIRVKRSDKRIISLNIENKIQNIACSDFLARRFFYICQEMSNGIRGTGYSGLITINEPGQAILERNNIIITDDNIEIRCFLGLPAEGRKINSQIAQSMFFNELVSIVEEVLLSKNIDQIKLREHISVAEDTDFLRNRLDSLGLIAFIAENSILPRKNGVCDKPLINQSIISFSSPESLKIEVILPHAGKLIGMGIPKGITLITGGGYNGKSTLLRTLEAGIYNHIPGDGREYCVSNLQTVKIRAYSGRSIVKTDISPFINNLPFNKDTTTFSTENASGSTSQAAGIIEAIEVGVEVLLMDEDTCATNFMIRDTKMQQLVIKADEPITTFIDKVKQLYSKKNISTVLVLGGVGDYFDICDLVIQMKNYKPLNKTFKAHEIAKLSPNKRKIEDEGYPFGIHNRVPVLNSIDPYNSYGKLTIYAKETHQLNFGSQVIDLTDLEQLKELAQTKALGFALEYAKEKMKDGVTLNDLVHNITQEIDSNGIDIISDRISGHFACFRAMELAFVINRFRGLMVFQK